MQRCINFNLAKTPNMSWIESAWYRKTSVTGEGKHWADHLLWLLLPFTLLFWLVSAIKAMLYKRAIKEVYRAPVPVIVVGNISVGGTGKTPFVIYMATKLKEKGYGVGIVSRGYGAVKSLKEFENSSSLNYDYDYDEGTFAFPRYVNEINDAKLTGDEPKLLAMRTRCPVYISPSRKDAIEALLENHTVDIVISDDGLQHYQMARDLEIVLIDGNRMHGNGRLIPMGPLREPISRLNNVDISVVNNGYLSALDMTSPIAQDYTLDATELVSFNGDKIDINNETRRVHLISGIGNPQRFEQTAIDTGLNVVSRLWFPDHHNFVEADFDAVKGINPKTDIVVMTEKDAVKCNGFASKHWFMLPIDARISPSLDQSIDNLIKTIKH